MRTVMVLEQNLEDNFVAVMVVLLTLFIGGLIIYKLFLFFEMAYVEYINKQLFFNHIYFKKRHLDPRYAYFLRKQFNFYQRLNHRQQKNFEHRTQRFIDNKQFIGKGVLVTDEMKVVIAATATKITFGLRDYKLPLLNKVLIYPDAYFSTTNEVYHKGEFNPAYRALVFSWKHVVEGYEIHDDNINLAIHETVHAIHFNYLRKRSKSSSAAIFLDSYNELAKFLNDNHHYRNNLMGSDYLRAYAHTNQFEFLAVLIETFIETPNEFQNLYPEIYIKIKQMLNFNFRGY
ncbi:zinc-dependent peptidase [Paucihalobacter sp.]|uniref:zinc-dependent peptidase n=1 Tax=Paucihalobacter sp. TaxID=2850405 RepID=UPI002FE3038D